MKKMKIALADDHQLFRSGLRAMLKDLEDFEIIYEADNGQELLDKISGKLKPDIILLDIKMPQTNGFEAVVFIKEHYPSIKIIVLSMFSDEASVMKMVKEGVEGYLLKDANKQEFVDALRTVSENEVYYSTAINKVIQKSFISKKPITIKLNENETKFLTLLCQQMSNKEIAEKMNLSIRTIDGYRDQLFEKLNVKSRIGLVLYAIKNKIVSI
ncbi:MAG: response regulator transcription factor [Bacteroidetes bacterium]|nr:response regulator transcription factor [Bacteroidota bacterium]MBU1485936.1 response regulator transcription factor [Bacteroidota bacterium]MBU2375938.1 response regulator transcription factor [Bacteroidota bacterium]